MAISIDLVVATYMREILVHLREGSNEHPNRIMSQSKVALGESKPVPHSGTEGDSHSMAPQSFGSTRAPQADADLPVQKNSPLGRELSTDDAEALGGGSYYFPSPSGASTRWRIFSRSVNESDPQYKVQGILDAVGDAKIFVDGVYRAILGREPDEGGLETYWKLLQNATIRPEDLIKILASSDEALGNGVCFVIYAEPDHPTEYTLGDGRAMRNPVLGESRG